MQRARPDKRKLATVAHPDFFAPNRLIHKIGAKQASKQPTKKCNLSAGTEDRNDERFVRAPDGTLGAARAIGVDQIGEERRVDGRNEVQLWRLARERIGPFPLCGTTTLLFLHQCFSPIYPNAPFCLA